MSNLQVDAELQTLVELPESELDVPEALLTLQPPTGPPSSASRELVRHVERDALIENLTGLRMPSPVDNVGCEPLGPAGVPISKAVKSTAQLRTEITQAIQKIAAAASDGDDPLGILKVAAADAPTVADGEGWREQARRLDRPLLAKLLAAAEEEPTVCGDLCRPLRLLSEA